MTPRALDALRELDVLAGVTSASSRSTTARGRRFVNPPLSVVVQPTYEIGRRTAELLLRRMRFRPAPGRCINAQPTTLMLSTELIGRASSQRTPTLPVQLSGTRGASSPGPAACLAWP